jgi:hypothetical protein
VRNVGPISHATAAHASAMLPIFFAETIASIHGPIRTTAVLVAIAPPTGGLAKEVVQPVRKGRPFAHLRRVHRPLRQPPVLIPRQAIGTVGVAIRNARLPTRLAAPAIALTPRRMLPTAAIAAISVKELETSATLGIVGFPRVRYRAPWRETPIMPLPPIANQSLIRVSR